MPPAACEPVVLHKVPGLCCTVAVQQHSLGSGCGSACSSSGRQHWRLRRSSRQCWVASTERG